MKLLLGQDSFFIKCIDVAIICLVATLVYLVAIKILNKIIDSKIANYSRNIKRKQTLASILKNIIKYIIVIIAFLTVLSRFGVDVSKMIAGLGIAGLVIGLGLQDMIKDFIAGLFILTDRGYEVGDIIEVDGFRGEVKEFGLKTTRIKNMHGEIRIVNNSNIRSFINCSLNNKNLILDLSFSNEVKDGVILSTIEKLLPSISEIKGVKIPNLIGLEEVGDKYNKFRIIISCKYNNQNDIRREVTRVLRETFAKKKPKIELIKIEVYNGKL